MIFVDTNVIMYAVGRRHPLREEAQRFFLDSLDAGEVLVSSAEVLQELLHACLPVNRLETVDAAMKRARGRLGLIWAIEREDIETARTLVERHAGLGARDLLHVACCMRRGVHRIKTYDRALAAALRAQ